MTYYDKDYYTNVVKPRQQANAYAMATKGSPEGACFIPGKPTTYCCLGNSPNNFALFLRTWAGSGRCIRRTVQAASSDSDTVEFEIDGDAYVVRIDDYTVWPASAMPSAPPEDLEHKAKAGVFFKGADVKLARSVQKGNNQAAVSRNYYRKKRIALAHYLPADFLPLPGETIAAYRRAGNVVQVVQPTTRALGLKLDKGDRLALKRTTHPIVDDGVFVFGEEFVVAEGTLAVRSLVKYRPLNLPDRTGWAEIIGGGHIGITTPAKTSNIGYTGHPSSRTYAVLEGDEFTFDDKRYKFSARGIVLA